MNDERRRERAAMTGEFCERRHSRPTLSRFCIRDVNDYKHYVCDRHLPKVLREIDKIGMAIYQRVLVMDDGEVVI